MSTEAWKDTGNCYGCRRQKYCHNDCSAKKRKDKKIAEKLAIASLVSSTRGKMLQEVAERTRQIPHEPPQIKRKIIIHGAMIYGCRDCGSRWVMFLERGLEEPCEDRKPVPFGIICPFCGGFHAYDISGYLPLPDAKYAELPDGESYFENRPDRDCGTPRIANPPKRL